MRRIKNPEAITVRVWNGSVKPIAVYVPARYQHLVTPATPDFSWCASGDDYPYIYITMEVSRRDSSQIIQRLQALLLLPVVYQD